MQPLLAGLYVIVESTESYNFNAMMRLMLAQPPPQPLIGKSAVTAPSPAANSHSWIMARAMQLIPRHMTGSRIAGLVMLMILIAFIASLMCVRMCWCGRRIPDPPVRRRKNTRAGGGRDRASATRWNERAARQAGFRPLLQNEESNWGADDEEDEEGETEDVIMSTDRDRTAITGLLRPDNKTATQYTLAELAGGMRGSPKRSGVNGDYRAVPLA